MPMHTGPTTGKPRVSVPTQPVQMSIAVGGLPALGSPTTGQANQPPEHHAAKREGDYRQLQSKYTVRLEDGTKAVAYSATPSPTRKRRQGQRRIQRGDPRHYTPGAVHYSPSRSPTIPDGTVSVPLPQYDLGGGFSLQQRAPLYVPTRPGFVVPDRLAPADQQPASTAGRDTIARQTLAPTLGSPQPRDSDDIGVRGNRCSRCIELQAELQRMASLLSAEEGKRKLLSQGLGAARAEIKQQRQQLEAKDAELDRLKRQQLDAVDPKGEGES